MTRRVQDGVRFAAIVVGLVFIPGALMTAVSACGTNDDQAVECVECAVDGTPCGGGSGVCVRQVCWQFCEDPDRETDGCFPISHGGGTDGSCMQGSCEGAGFAPCAMDGPLGCHPPDPDPVCDAAPTPGTSCAEVAPDHCNEDERGYQCTGVLEGCRLLGPCADGRGQYCCPDAALTGGR